MQQPRIMPICVGDRPESLDGPDEDPVEGGGFGAPVAAGPASVWPPLPSVMIAVRVESGVTMVWVRTTTSWRLIRSGWAAMAGKGAIMMQWGVLVGWASMACGE